LLGQHAAAVVFQSSVEKNIKPDFYKNKILVLDFWATWCAPCIASFPHFNMLSEKFSSEGVVFASLTDEPENVAVAFFKRTGKQLKALKLIDTAKISFKNFGVDFIPLCLVIDNKNVIRWAGQSIQLTEQVLSSIIADKVFVNKDPGGPTEKMKNKPIAQRALFSFNAARSDSTKESYEGGGYTYSYRNMITTLSEEGISLENFLQKLTGYSKEARFITNDTTRMKQHIDVFFRAEKDSSLFQGYRNLLLKSEPRKNLILSLLQESLKFKIEFIKREQPVYELYISDESKLKAFANVNNGHKSFSDEVFPHFETAGYGLGEIAVQLENEMKTVIDWKGTSLGQFDLSLDVTNFATLNKSLAFHGLTLRQAHREVELLNVIFY